VIPPLPLYRMRVSVVRTPRNIGRYETSHGRPAPGNPRLASCRDGNQAECIGDTGDKAEPRTAAATAAAAAESILAPVVNRQELAIVSALRAAVTRSIACINRQRKRVHIVATYCSSHGDVDVDV